VRCLGCGAKVDPLGGVICPNFGWERCPGQGKCNVAWHGACYTQHIKDKFPVLGVKDLDDALLDEGLLEEDNLLRLQETREGDHLLCFFQCDDCHFQNMRGRWPLLGNLFDLLTMLCIRRAILDLLWAGERSMVNSNRLEGVRYLGIFRVLGLEKDAYPLRGPFPLEDTWGMRVACAVLIRSLGRGRNADTIQYETIRKLPSHIANFIHTCRAALESGLWASKEWQAQFQTRQQTRSGFADA
jgi:hypothetical protein